MAVNKVKEIAVSTADGNQRENLRKLAATAMSSKLIHRNSEFFTKMVVDAVLSLDQDDLNDKLIGIKKITGGSLQDSLFVNGVASRRPSRTLDLSNNPKYFKNPKIVCLNVELELKSEKDNARILKISTEYGAATGAQTQSTCSNILPQNLGTCDAFEERQIGSERFNFFEGCPEAKTCTLVLRGGAEQFIAEVERSLHDAIMIVKRAIKNTSIVAGGGACEMELSAYLHNFADKKVPTKQQAIIKAFAKALEVIPRQLCDNAGFDSTDILNRLRVEHKDGHVWAGVDVQQEGVRDNLQAFVWDQLWSRSMLYKLLQKQAVLSFQSTKQSKIKSQTFNKELQEVYHLELHKEL
ncbi:hypothetical protein MRB53_039855 [Persea americana]|nr:hypothetical protein MRB53_039855 [Persea americana]